VQFIKKFMRFTSDGRRNKEIDTRFGKANAVLCKGLGKIFSLGANSG